MFSTEMLSRNNFDAKQPYIGQLVRALRQQLGQTQEQFATQLGVTFTTINRWENNRTKPSPLAIKQIELQLRQMGESGKNLLDKHLVE